MLNLFKITLLTTLCLSPLILLAQYSNNNRRVLLFTDSPNNTITLQQQGILTAEEAGCLDRDIVVETFVLDKTDKKLLKKYGISSAPFTFLLIGKDGHVALRSFKIVPKTQLFALIDGMPMRRDEMRRKKQ